MDLSEGISILARLGTAILVGVLIGIERQLHGRWADLRTHVTVSLGAAIFTIGGVTIAAGSIADTTRVVQGIAAGVGFLGAGTILKLSDQLEVKGLTTASAIWLTAALGTAAGLGNWWLAFIGTATSLLVLALLRPIEKRFGQDGENEP